MITVKVAAASFPKEKIKRKHKVWKKKKTAWTKNQKYEFYKIVVYRWSGTKAMLYRGFPYL